MLGTKRLVSSCCSQRAQRTGGFLGWGEVSGFRSEVPAVMRDKHQFALYYLICVGGPREGPRFPASRRWKHAGRASSSPPRPQSKIRRSRA